MHFLKGTESFVRCKVVKPKEIAMEDMQKELLANSFSSRNISPNAEEVFGWVDPSNCLKEPQLSDMILEPHIRFTMRVDKKKIPSALMEAHYEIEESATLAAEGKEKLSVGRKRDLRRQVKDMLILQTSPTTQLYRGIYNYSTHELLIFNTSNSIIKKFAKLFTESFGVEVMQLTPWSLGYTWARKNKRKNKFAETEPMKLVRKKNDS